MVDYIEDISIVRDRGKPMKTIDQTTKRLNGLGLMAYLVPNLWHMSDFGSL